VRIVLLAVDDEFAGRMQQDLYRRHRDKIVGSVISTCSIYKKTPLQATLFVLRKSGWRFGAEMFRMKVMRKLTRREPVARPSQLARAHGVEVFMSGNINQPESLQQLERWAPDLVISTNFSHYLGKRARAVARTATLNLHKSYLSQYRGMAPSFFALLEGAREVGATLHLVDDGFDTGDLVDQIRVPVEPSDSVYSLNRKTSEAGGRMLAEWLEGAEPGSVQSVRQPDGEWPNHTYPSPAQVRAFLRKGLRF
jgi:folate-dependent phosphoribosylglycinamide formyltransferase PurN